MSIVRYIIMGGISVGWHCYRNYTHYNTGGSNITGGIIVGDLYCPHGMVQLTYAIGQFHHFLMILDMDLNRLLPTIFIPFLCTFKLEIHKQP